MLALRCHLLPSVNGICWRDRCERERCCLIINTLCATFFLFCKILFSVSTFYFSPSVRFFPCFSSPFCLLPHSCIPFFSPQVRKGSMGAPAQYGSQHLSGSTEMGRYLVSVHFSFQQYFLGIFTNFKRKISCEHFRILFFFFDRGPSGQLPLGDK